jgi:hypothetical protein
VASLALAGRASAARRLGVGLAKAALQLTNARAEKLWPAVEPAIRAQACSRRVATLHEVRDWIAEEAASNLDAIGHYPMRSPIRIGRKQPASVSGAGVFLSPFLATVRRADTLRWTLYALTPKRCASDLRSSHSGRRSFFSGQWNIKGRYEFDAIPATVLASYSFSFDARGRPSPARGGGLFFAFRVAPRHS